MSEKRKATSTSGSGSGGGVGVSASSFLGLKAELEKTRREARASGRRQDERQRDKKLPVHLRSSPGGVEKRDGERRGGKSTSRWSTTPSAQLDTIRVNLERKAALYDKLERGKFGLPGALDQGLIDWQRKAAERTDDEHSDPNQSLSPSPSLSLSLSLSLGHDDPLIEYQDEFGRTRNAPLSEVPRDLVPPEYGGSHQHDNHDSAEDNAIYGPSTSFPVYQPAPGPAGSSRSGRGPESHFDADWEVRHRGAAFYNFSKDETQRRAQMAELQHLRTQTETAHSQPQPSDPSGSAKRRARLQERHRLVDAKRLRLLSPQGVEERKRRIQQTRLDSLLS